MLLGFSVVRACVCVRVCVGVCRGRLQMSLFVFWPQKPFMPRAVCVVWVGLGECDRD